MGMNLPENAAGAKPVNLVDAEKAVEFLDWIATGPGSSGRIAIAMIGPDTGKVTGWTFDLPGDRSRLLGGLTKSADLPAGQRFNAYFTLNDPKPAAEQEGRAGKLCEGDVQAIRGIAVDIDPRGGVDLDAERDRLRQIGVEALADADCPAAVVIDSGNGVQLLWLFEEPLPNTPENREAVKRQAAGLAKHFGGDAVQSLDHLFRIPFTWNVPNKRKRDLGRVECVSGLIGWQPECRVTLEALAAIAPPADAVREPTKAADMLPIDFAKVMDAAEGGPEALPDALRLWADRLRERPGFAPAMAKSDRSARDYQLAANCIGMGMTAPTEIAQVVFALSPEKLLEEEETRGAGERHAQRTVSRALAECKPDPKPEDFFDRVVPEGVPATVDDTKAELAIHTALDRLLAKVSTGLVDPTGIPPREWIVEPRLPRGDVSLLTGAPGISKSTWAIRDLLALVTGRGEIIEGRDENGNPIAGERVHRDGPVIVYNAEDTRWEMERRLAAAQRRYGIAEAEMRHPYLLWSGVDGEHLTIMQFDRNGNGTPAAGLQLLESVIERVRPALVYLDPLASLKRGGDENSTDDMDAMMQELARLAARTGTAICVVHHTAKGTEGARGDLKAARGAGAIGGKVRAAVTLCRVTGAAEDEKALGFTAADGVIVMDYAKTSASERPASATFFRRQNVFVGNGEGEPPGNVEAAEFFSEDLGPAERLRRFGDSAPVLELIDVRSRLREGAQKAGAKSADEAAKIAEIVASILGDETSAQWGQVWERVAGTLQRAGVLKGVSRNVVTPRVVAALGGDGVEVCRNGHLVRVRARQEGSGERAPWLIELVEVSE